mgnify:CR=1 FL=1
MKLREFLWLINEKVYNPQKKKEEKFEHEEIEEIKMWNSEFLRHISRLILNTH